MVHPMMSPTNDRSSLAPALNERSTLPMSLPAEGPIALARTTRK
jgi:hypothetical protein